MVHIPEGRADDLEHAAMPPIWTTHCAPRKLFTRDKEYVVRDGEIIIVDELTGRLMRSGGATRRASTRRSSSAGA